MSKSLQQFWEAGNISMSHFINEETKVQRGHMLAWSHTDDKKRNWVWTWLPGSNTFPLDRPFMLGPSSSSLGVVVLTHWATRRRTLGSSSLKHRLWWWGPREWGGKVGCRNQTWDAAHEHLSNSFQGEDSRGASDGLSWIGPPFIPFLSEVLSLLQTRSKQGRVQSKGKQEHISRVH